MSKHWRRFIGLLKSLFKPQHKPKCRKHPDMHELYTFLSELQLTEGSIISIIIYDEVWNRTTKRLTPVTHEHHFVVKGYKPRYWLLGLLRSLFRLKHEPKRRKLDVSGLCAFLSELQLPVGSVIGIVIREYDKVWDPTSNTFIPVLERQDQDHYFIVGRRKVKRAEEKHVMRILSES